MKRICIYHSADLDGHCSGAIVKKRYPDVELVGWDYGQPIPDVGGFDEVILVDISFSVAEMRAIESNRSFVWIDHHKTAIEKAEKEKFFPHGHRMEWIAACELAYRFFFPDRLVPWSVVYLGLWDVWKWEDHEHRKRIEAFQYGMRSVETRPELCVDWPFLLNNGPESDSLVNDFCRKGLAIIGYRDKQNAMIARSAFETEIDGHRVLALNAGGGSQVFDSVWSEHKDCVAMLAFVWVGGYWKVSLYSDRDFDCSVVCSAHGGGGHAKASGFECVELPFTPFSWGTSDE